VGADGGSGEVRAPTLRVMAWVEIMDVREPATTEWRLFRHVREQIRDAAQKVPGLNLREMACYVDDGGTLVKPFDLSRLQRCDQEYIGFEFDGGERKDVKRRHVLPSADPEAVLKLVLFPAAVAVRPSAEQQDDRAQPSASQGRLPVIEGFFCKKIPDKKQLLRGIEAVKRADPADKDERLTQLEAQLKALETIDVHKEAQELKRCLSGGRRVFEVSVNPQPSFDTFNIIIRSAKERNVRLLHLAGHGESRCGFFWLKDQAVSTEYEEVLLDTFLGILKT
jgi:hypothetical protein